MIRMFRISSRLGLRPLRGCAAPVMQRAALSQQNLRIPTQIRVLTSETNDPFFNIATEEWLLEHEYAKEAPFPHTLFLWRNAPTVVIGRSQNPYKECHLARMQEDGVHLVRRYSGGGAVYHDLGNTNFTFLSLRTEYDKSRNFNILVNALNTLGIPAQISGRNDVTVDNMKVSGSAFKITNDRVFHHGTILINVDMNQLGKYLNPNKEKLKSKGVASVQARVLNMINRRADLNHDMVCDALVKSFFDSYQLTAPIEVLSKERLAAIPKLQTCYEKLKDWNWNYGQCPFFEHQMEKRFNWGIVDVNINSQYGKIVDVAIFSDSLYPELITALQTCLLGVEYSRPGIHEGCDIAYRMFAGEPIQEHVLEFRDWLSDML
eukprot:TRINITY_DN10998_c0_g1_i1.p1 TRINITY_DN10998_c0_g1~~TRINITY_DN10998_c0_g1_i1.p1  ORF type:complete len:376 (+),score=62.25 TRINITY_DN10998_c0_g1_i1:3-1130(+)